MKAVKKSFSAVIKASERGGAYVEMPFRVAEVFGTRGRVAVNATFDGVPYRGSLAPMGGCHMLGVLKSIRAELGKEIGDSVKVTIEADTEPREVTVPDDFAKTLAKNKTAKAIFEKLSYTHRKEYVRWIEDAKREETRARRVEKMVGMLGKGKKPTI